MELKTVILYKNDEKVIVNAGAQESAYRADGWTDKTEEKPKAKKK